MIKGRDFFKSSNKRPIRSLKQISGAKEVYQAMLGQRQKGFTLVELAIVLVIIGIIIGAVLKGQDLIQNARAKKFVSKAKSWEVAQWTFFDREGRFAGDYNANGIIGDDTTNASVKADLTSASFINPPYEGTSGSETNTITLGSYQFYVFFGNDGTRNIMVICKDSACGNTFSSEELTYIKAFDTAFDGSADGTAGQVIGATTPGSVSTSTWIASYSSAPTATALSSAKAVVYYFDAKR